MKTYRLWFEADSEFPRFQRLGFEEADVAIADVLKRGIHPAVGDDSSTSAKEKFVEILNDDGFRIPELDQLGYCCDVPSVTHSYYMSHRPTLFQQTLNLVCGGVYFVEELSYGELLRVARERLKETWSHKVAEALLGAACSGFDAMRQFLKARDKSVKISGYDDFDRYDLGEILRLEDFEHEEQILIRQALPVTNFRSTRFLEKVTDDQGLLRFIDSIDNFQVSVKGLAYETLHYNCERSGDRIRFRPHLENSSMKRDMAGQVATQWRTDRGKYCFTTDIDVLPHMIHQNGYTISFPSLNYVTPRQPGTSSVAVQRSRVDRFAVGKYLALGQPVASFKDVLRNHGVSMTGRKEQLGEKLAALSVRLYQEREAELDDFFAGHPFIKVASGTGNGAEAFPVLQDLDLRNMVLAMYVLKHLRGNTILEASHENDAFGLDQLARGLVRGEVSVNGVFLGID